MAIVENSFPGGFASAYRPICWDLTEANASVVKLKIEHKIDGVIVATTYHLPVIGTTDNYIIDGSNIASNFVTYDLVNDYGLQPTTFNSEVDYELVATGLDVNGDAVGGSLLTTNSTYVENIPIQHTDSQNMVDLELIDNTDCILSNRPTSSNIYTNQFIPINVFGDGLDFHAKIDAYLNGVSINTSIVQMEINAVSNRAATYIDTSSVFFNGADEVKLQIFDDVTLTGTISKEYSMRLNQYCNDHCEVHFLNCLGGFDSFMFTGDKETKTRVKRKRFKQTVTKNWNISDRGQSILGTKSEKEITLYSRFLNDGETLMLEDLINSPEVFLIENNEFVPMVVKDGSFTTKSSKGLIQYKVVLEYANDKIVACV